jgi:hypothetical protein
MEEREESRRQQTHAKAADSRAADRQRERESLELSRLRVLRDLEAAHNPNYREILRRSLEYLDGKLSLLNSETDKRD